ncbi:MAG: S41 family peptidase [Muribaculum sp.]|nr:S41 family peptidase [Muribaculum sp.]
MEEPTIPSENAFEAQNRWIYSQMNRNYLWREDLPDSLACNFNQNTKEFFESILSPKDRFSYLTTNSDYSLSRQNSWGFAYQKFMDRNGRVGMQVLYKIRYNQNITEGDWLMSIDDEEATFVKLEISEKGLFEIIPNSEFEISSSISSIVSSTNTVICDTVYMVDNKKIGYMCYVEFDDIADLQDPMKKFKESNINELILDLRYNPGGFVNTCNFLCNCIVPESAYEKVFQQCSYNDILSAYYEQTTGYDRTFTFFKKPHKNDATTIGTPVVPLNLKRIFILTSKHTASASEAAIICMRPYMDVTMIGETTVGKGVGSRNFSDNQYKYAIQPIIMRYYNSLGETTPDEGLTPDYYISDGYSTPKREIGDTQESLLNYALSLIVPTAYQFASTSRSIKLELENTLTPIGEPSYVTEFNNKQYNESN